MKRPTIFQKENEHPWATYFRREVLRKNQCINALATGKTGSGKSWGMLKLLSQADPTFNVDRIFFKASEMLRWTETENDLKGKAFMFDEAGVDAAASQWWDDINQALKIFFQTQRSKNYICGITVPYIKEISTGVRRHINVRIYADGADKKFTHLRAYTYEYNDDMDKYYKKKLLVKTLSGDYSYCSGLNLEKADQKLIDDYEKKKDDWQKLIRKDINTRLVKHEVKMTGEPQPLTETENKVLETSRIVEKDQIGADLLGIHIDMYRKHKRMCRVKGYDTKRIEKEANSLEKLSLEDIRQFKPT